MCSNNACLYLFLFVYLQMEKFGTNTSRVLLPASVLQTPPTHTAMNVASKASRNLDRPGCQTGTVVDRVSPCRPPPGILKPSILMISANPWLRVPPGRTRTALATTPTRPQCTTTQTTTCTPRVTAPVLQRTLRI
jgi:hypothetical protein